MTLRISQSFSNLESAPSFLYSKFILTSMGWESNQKGGDGKIHGNEIAQHSTNEDCWVIIHGRAYDVTDFKEEHPGGKAIILKWAGKDATETYEPLHAPDTLDKYLDRSKHMGEVDMSTVQPEPIEDDPDETERQQRIRRMPSLDECFNLIDFEAVARMVMKNRAWAYYSSGADDEIVSLDSLLSMWILT